MDSGSTAFTEACVATGMNAGVWIRPCGVVITPVRPSGAPSAPPVSSRCVTSKPNCEGCAGAPEAD